MGKLKKAIVATASVVLALVTVRTIRNRRNPSVAVTASPDEKARSEASEAITHAFEAVSHARAAGENTVEYARTEFDQAKVGTVEAVEEEPRGRISRIAKGWMRR